MNQYPTRVRFLSGVARTLIAAALCTAAAPGAALCQAGPPVAPASSRLSHADLEELLAPIALYPDTLLANTLAACVYMDDLRAAYQIVTTGRAPGGPPRDQWDPTVQSLAEFPDVIRLLGGNLKWAEAIGQANVLQGPDLMKAVQSLRARAWNSGALRSGAQQTVVTEGSTIIIESATPQVIYVPQYNPQVVYVESTSSSDVAAAGLIGFGLGIAVTAIWADLDCDWHVGCVSWGWGHHHWHGGGNDININNININNNTWNNVNRPGQGGQPWRPNSDRVRPTEWVKDGRQPAFANYRGVGTTGVNTAAQIPGREGGARPIAASGAPPAPRPRPATTARPTAPTPRPATQDRPIGVQNPTPGNARQERPAARPDTQPIRSETPQRRQAEPRSSGLRPGGSHPVARPAPRGGRGR